MKIKQKNAYKTGLVSVLCAAFLTLGVCHASIVKMPSTADIWLSDANAKERQSSSGKARRFKLKSIQEMAAIRFNTEPVRGKEILSARLYLHCKGNIDHLKYIRLSTITQDWEEGNSSRDYGKASGATFEFADANSGKPWAWPGSDFTDVSFSSGNSLACWDEVRKEREGWISVAVLPDLIYAMTVGDSDGLAIAEGGTISLFNLYFSSHENGGFEPYLLVETGKEITVSPSPPTVQASPALSHADERHGAVQITIDESKNTPPFCWEVFLNGKKLETWRTGHPQGDGSSQFYIDGLAPDKSCNLKVVAVSKSGHKSQPTSLIIKSSGRLITDFLDEGDRNLAGAENCVFSNHNMIISALPGMVKADPLLPAAKFDDIVLSGKNKEISLTGVQGETIDFQLCMEPLNEKIEKVRISADGLEEVAESDIFQNWCAKTKQGRWQPAYALPINKRDKRGVVHLEDAKQRIPKLKNHTFYVDLYIKKNAPPGIHHGLIQVEDQHKNLLMKIPITLDIKGLSLPDRLSFLPEMNAYRIPRHVHDYYRLAHEHRCVANFWTFRPRVSGSGEDIKVDWKQYDRIAGPLLSGKAFADCRRKNVPVDVMYLPFIDNWPTELNPSTYRYKGHWPGRGESRNYITAHYLHAPYIGDGLSRGYKTAFAAVQKQFFEHFKKKGWNQTEMQLFFGGKNTHRIDYGANLWWTTDEPYHWDDWLALQFFNGLWTKGRIERRENAALWPARADISRPQWQGRVLEGVTDVVYYGGFSSKAQCQRARIIKEETGVKVRAYGSAGSPDKPGTQTFLILVNAWLDGADAFLPWQTLGTEQSLDKQESCEGNALFVPGKRFGLNVVGDLRLKAFRNGQQFIEYLVMLQKKYKLTREQIKLAIHNALGKNCIYDGRIQRIDVSQIDALRCKILKLLLHENEDII